MIFNKILRSSNLSFDIVLDKTHYSPSEKVTGRISVKAEKASKVRQLILVAEGKESTSITVSESNGFGSGKDRASRTYTEVNIFFSKDLSSVLQKTLTFNRLSDGTLEILPQNKDIAFDFVLPASDGLFSSYKGNHAKVSYSVKAIADKAKMLDVNKEVQFSVINHNNNRMVSSTTDSSLSHDETIVPDNNIRTTSAEEKGDAFAAPGIEGSNKHEIRNDRYSARFEQIFGRKNKNYALPESRHKRFFYTSKGTDVNFDLGTIFAKGREDFLKDSSSARIDLLGANNVHTIYTRGEKIEGDIILLSPQKAERGQRREHEEMGQNKIRGMKITLFGIENAFAQGFQRTNIIEKYQKDMHIDISGTQNENGASNKIPFEFQIPEAINQSYVGKYSEYFWGLEAKVNIAWSSDIKSRTIIEIT